MNRLRFAPSPTGFVHIGGLRTALYNYLYAKQTNGKYILRIEDTDQTRLVEGATQGIIDSLSWAGVNHDEGPYIQSERLDLYQKEADRLVAQGDAYYCFCSKERLNDLRDEMSAKGLTPKYDGHCKSLSQEEISQKLANGEPHVIRLKFPENLDIHFKDAIKGDVTVNTNDLDDQVLMKQDGFPTYHMAVVVDDHDMQVTHVLRGDEWLISTPKHIFLYEKLGWKAPEYVHLPVILGKDKKKLSKRQGDVSVDDFRKKGYLPEALINYIALVGWSPEDGSEIMTMEEMIQKFSFDRVSKSGGVFDLDKLNWVNNHYIRAYDIKSLLELAKPYFIESGFTTEQTYDQDKEKLTQILELIKERLNNLSEIKDFAPLFTNETVEIHDDEAREIQSQPYYGTVVKAFTDKIKSCETLTPESIKAIFKEIQKETGHKGKELFMPVRVAVSGSAHGVDIAIAMSIMGKDLVLKRLGE